MTVANYIDRLKTKYGYSLPEISEMTGIRYSTLSAIKNDDNPRRRLSLSFLDNLSKIENLKPYEVFYLIEAENDLKPSCTETVLMYLSQKYCENYSISYSDITISYEFGGSFITKRTGANLTVVDDWDILVKDAWTIFFGRDEKELDNEDYYKEVLPTKKNFYLLVLWYGIDRIRRNLKERKIRNYHIVFSNLEDMQVFDESDVKNYKPFKLELLHIEVPDKYKFDNVRFVDENH